METLATAAETVDKNSEPETSLPESETPPASSHSQISEPSGRYLAGLSLAALGVVYGDIGTSPLYAMRESFHSSYGLAPSPANVLGIVSLITWSLMGSREQRNVKPG